MGFMRVLKVMLFDWADFFSSQFQNDLLGQNGHYWTKWSWNSNDCSLFWGLCFFFCPGRSQMFSAWTGASVCHTVREPLTFVFIIMKLGVN